jgi:hypothetical protein
MLQRCKCAFNLDLDMVCDIEQLPVQLIQAIVI